MALSVIGSGFGRTGTMSLKFALEQLGFGRCYHMTEVRSAGHVDAWCAIARREPADWPALFAGFGAAIDWPACNYWRELAEAFPQAKVIHTTRPPEEWWASFERTIAVALTRRPASDDPVRRKMRAMTTTIIADDVFAGRPTDKRVALAAFHAREAAVRAAIPPARLLVLDPREGWGRLCAFLGVAVPDAPWPHTNTTADFQAAAAQQAPGPGRA